MGLSGSGMGRLGTELSSSTKMRALLWGPLVTLILNMRITFFLQGPPGIRGPPGKDGERGEKVRHSAVSQHAASFLNF